MKKQSWAKRDPIENYFPLPNELYDLNLSRGAIVVYGFLLRCENRKTYPLLIALSRCANTVRGIFNPEFSSAGKSLYTNDW